MRSKCETEYTLYLIRTVSVQHSGVGSTLKVMIALKVITS